MTDETKSKISILSDSQIFSLFWFLYGFYKDNPAFEKACKIWLETLGAARIRAARS